MAKDGKKVAERVRRPLAERLLEAREKTRILEGMAKVGDDVNATGMLRGAKAILATKPFGKGEVDKALKAAQSAVQGLLAAFGL